MCPTTSSDRRWPACLFPGLSKGQSGFTLAGVIVILTVIMVFVAYTVPRQWSQIMGRERDRQTIFIMRQYARAIMEWQRLHGGLPTSITQLKDAKLPRFIRNAEGEYVDPLTGQVDWILVPPGQGGGPGGALSPAGGPPGSPTYVPGSDPRYLPNAKNPSYGSPAPGTPPSGVPGSTGQARPGGSPKDYVGPFAGVRPNKQGPSFIAFNGNENYEQWTFTITDLQNEIKAREAALVTAR